MRFVDLFAGLGGFHLAATQLGGRCVFASEIDEALRDIYGENFGFRPEGDITKVHVNDIPEHDLLCAGFPCQPFSKAGEQVGWGDSTRGTVFHNIAKIVEKKRPRFVLMENVAHFVRHDEGNTYRRVQEVLEKLGYEVDYRQYSPHQFGIPQIRDRIYMVATSGTLTGFNWPVPQGPEPKLVNILDKKPKEAVPLNKQVLQCLNTWQKFLSILPKTAKLPSFPIWSMEFGATYPTSLGRLGPRVLNDVAKTRGCFGASLSGMSWNDLKKRLPSHALRQRDHFPTWKRTFIRQNREFYKEHERRLRSWLPLIQSFPPSLQKLEWNCQGEARDVWKYVIQFRASGVRVKRPSTSPSLVAMTATQIPIIGWEKRYMTSRECARLQSMGELMRLPQGIRAYEALGNAVNVTVAAAIIREILSFGARKDNPSNSSETLAA